jgi:hypothetical protein
VLFVVDLTADPILFLVQHALFCTGDVTTVESRVEPLLSAKVAILGPQVASLGTRQRIIFSAVASKRETEAN